jgi:predicted acylesterase/phospholipase RssA
MDRKKLIQTAQRYLRGEDIPLTEVRDCADKLYGERMFNYSRRLYARLCRTQSSDEKLRQRWAISTYKDDDQPGEMRFDEAAEILFSHYGYIPEDLKLSEVSGILGSIFKQKWRMDNQESWLKTSLRFYNQGMKLWEEAWQKEMPSVQAYMEGKADKPKTSKNFRDQGYCSINAAYICDTLAARLREAGGNDPVLSAQSQSLRQEASRIRSALVEFCQATEAFFQQGWEEEKKESGYDPNASTKSPYWFYATWAEALLGTGAQGCAEAVKKMKQAVQYSAPNSWHRDSTGQQVANWIAEEHFDKPITASYGDAKDEYRAHAAEVLSTVLGTDLHGSRSQKMGLALSGGGFRASLFHIGVLARLAEQNLLRNVEVISCVSGGSIIGAFYYLKIRELYQSKTDDEINQEDYIEVVRQIQHEFLAYINTDLRSNLFRNLWDNVRMALFPGYSRTSRLADLYEKRLYAKVFAKDDPCDPHIYMTDLLIRPKGDNGEPMNVSPKRDNWKRRNKVPMLVLNATTLNTGHCWQFTATWMGEPPGYINSETDAMPTFRRMYYDGEAPAPHHKIRLATAVGASSCVPGLFKPVELRDLYRLNDGTSIDVQLVDGGVYDNQGLNTLLEQECNLVIISDAAGQMASVNDPKAGIVSVGGRTNAILQERVRAAQLDDLEARYGSKLLKGYLLMHLTKGLPSEAVNWRLCDDPYQPNIIEGEQNGDDVLTPYGIRKNIQTALARVRTDLDAFHEQEAYMLMYSGYLMTDYELREGSGSGERSEKEKQEEKEAKKAGKATPEQRPSMAFPLHHEPGEPPAAKPDWTFFRIRQQHDDAAESDKLHRLLKFSAGTVKIHRVSAVVQGLLAAVVAAATSGLLYLLFSQQSLRDGLLTLLTGAGALAAFGLLYWLLVLRLRFNPLAAVPRLVLGLLVSPLTALIAAALNAEYLRAGRIKRKDT